MKNGNLFEYIFAIRRKTLATDENGNWEGSLSQINKALEKNSQQIKVNFERKFTVIQNEQEAMVSRLNDLDGKINDQNGTISSLADAMSRIPQQMISLPEQIRTIIREEKNGSKNQLQIPKDSSNSEQQSAESTMKVEKTSSSQDTVLNNDQWSDRPIWLSCIKLLHLIS